MESHSEFAKSEFVSPTENYSQSKQDILLSGYKNLAIDDSPKKAADDSLS